MKELLFVCVLVALLYLAMGQTDFTSHYAELAAPVPQTVAAAAASAPGRPRPRAPAPAPLGRLDRALRSPAPRVPAPDSDKFAAILHESNPVELQRQLLISTVQNQVLCERLKRAAAHRTLLLERLERARDLNEDLKFRLEEKTVELEGTKATLKQLEDKQASGPYTESLEEQERQRGRERQRQRERSRSHSSMREMEPLHMPGESEPAEGGEARRRPSRIPLHRAAHKGAAPRPPPAPAAHPAPPARPPSQHSTRSAASARSRSSLPRAAPPAAPAPAAPPAPPAPAARRSPPHHDSKKTREAHAERNSESEPYRDSLNFVTSSRADLVAEYLARTERLIRATQHPLFSRLQQIRARPLPADLPDYGVAYESPQNLALELSKSILYDNSDSIDVALKSLNSHGEDSLWNGKPQQYFESMNYGGSEDNVADAKDYDSDSLVP